MRISDWSSDVCSSDLLAGFALERGNPAAPYPALDAAAAAQTRARAEAMMTRHVIAVADADDIAAWRGDDTRTPFLFDLRTPEDIVSDSSPSFRPAPPPQTVQAPDQCVCACHARLVLPHPLGLLGAVSAFELSPISTPRRFA